jgi:hypothetical protein
LKYILSIGYEMETGTFSKLTKTDIVEDPDDLILYNTDTARKDIITFKKLSESEEFEILDDDLISRMEEMVDADAYNDKNEVDKNIIFNITSDVSMTPFYKKLNKICDEEKDKNDLYIFKTLAGEEYKFNFIFKDDRTCAEFSFVEWLFTYLKPEQSPSVVIDTYTNAISNLIRHLNDLEEIEGNLILNTDNGEFIIDQPEVRSLYHKPDTNLYYLQTQVFDEKLTLDDVCFTSQMTFASKIENVFLVMKTLTKDNLNVISDLHENAEYKMYVLNMIETTVNNLIESYNEKLADPGFQIVMKKDNIKIIRIITAYLQLILFKLNRYYNDFMNTPKEKRKYFKNSLFFNSRHSNYHLYQELKKNMKTLFLPQLTQMYNGDEIQMNNAIANIIQKLVVQPDILSRDFIETETKVRKNVFSPKNIIDKNTIMYGNPSISLLSYFQFFEQPTEVDDNITDEGKIYTHDWLEFSELDNKSARMDLKDDIILIEYRGFQKMLSSYIYSIADDSLKDMMTNGICNRLGKKFRPDLGALSLGIMKRFVELQSSRSGVGVGGRKTRKNRKYNKSRRHNK